MVVQQNAELRPSASISKSVVFNQSAHITVCYFLLPSKYSAQTQNDTDSSLLRSVNFHKAKTILFLDVFTLGGLFCLVVFL